jgi:hypothetical protein
MVPPINIEALERTAKELETQTGQNPNSNHTTRPSTEVPATPGATPTAPPPHHQKKEKQKKKSPR